MFATGRGSMNREDDRWCLGGDGDDLRMDFDDQTSEREWDAAFETRLVICS